MNPPSLTKQLVLKTLPNIDINIKTGNSLISKLHIDDNYNRFTNKNRQDIHRIMPLYHVQVAFYKGVQDKVSKQKILQEIQKYKLFFQNLYNPDDKDFIAWKMKENEILALGREMSFDENYTERLEKLQAEATALEQKYSSKMAVFENAFEWRYEFPEVCDADGKFVGFDVVIGNPPYISAPAMVNNYPTVRKAISDSKRFATLYQKWDLFIPFIELGLQLLPKNGLCAMIVPYPLTNQTYGMKLRELILNQYNLIDLVDLNGAKVFENATVSNCIPIISKSTPSQACNILNLTENGQIEVAFVQDFADLVQDENTLVWNLTAEKREANRHNKMNVLGDFCYISVGMVLNADEKTAKGEFSKEDLISESYDEIHCRKYIEAKDIESYRVKKVRYLEYNTPRCPDRLRRPTFRELYDKPKLMFNRLGNLMVILDEETNFLHSDSMYSAVLWKDLAEVENKSILSSIKRYSYFTREEMTELSQNVDLHYLLGILNSKYAAVLLTALRGGDYHIYPEHIRNLPIPTVSPENQEKIVSWVKQIVSMKQDNAHADTLSLENEIDQLVYQLYALTPEEIALVEGQK